MKKLYFLSLILCMILLGTKTNAQPIPVFAYQGIAVNADGQRLSNQSITLRFSVMYGSITGTLVYVETQATSTDGSGHYTVQIGQGTPSYVYPGTLAPIANPFYLKVEMDAAAGNNYVVVSKGPIAISLTAKVCGNTFTVNHTVAGGVAPVDKTTTYSTVGNVPGTGSKCWITSNLGADHQATKVDDSTENSAGWYFQFNIKKGYKNDGTGAYPTWPGDVYIYSSSDWMPGNDPCSLELGNGWRIPTQTEWTAVDASGNWLNRDDAWNSALKLHAAGRLSFGTGEVQDRGVYGWYKSSTQKDAWTDWSFFFATNPYGGDACYVLSPIKDAAFTLRCIRD